MGIQTGGVSAPLKALQTPGEFLAASVAAAAKVQMTNAR
jgi:hypothetical protein